MNMLVARCIQSDCVYREKSGLMKVAKARKMKFRKNHVTEVLDAFYDDVDAEGVTVEETAVEKVWEDLKMIGDMELSDDEVQ